MQPRFLPGRGITGRARLTREPLPPYSYVPGHNPHPESDAAGHMHGHEVPAPPPLDPQAWRDSPTFCRAVDMFNHGYYWEAHEMWEGLWHAADRQGTTAEFLKGLIKLAAAAVKARAGNARGVERHARRAEELFQGVQALLPAAQDVYGGLPLSDLTALARRWQHDSAALADRPDPLRVVDALPTSSETLR